MIKLKSLSLGNVGRFTEPQSIDFTGLGNLIQIDGENRNTGGSSGAGKSTIFNALDYLLGLNDLPTTVLQSRLTKSGMEVVGVFDWDGKEVMITRGKKEFSIQIDGQTVEGSSKITEEKLDEILGMPRDLFRKILHKRQKEGGFFLEFAPKKMYQFLTDCLNLAAERKKLEKVELKLSDLEKQKNARQTAITALQSSLRTSQESILALGLPPIRDIHQSVILELKGKYDVSTQRFKEVEEKHKLQTQELEKERPQVSVTAYDSSKRIALEERRASLASRVNAILREESERINGVKTLISEKNVEKSKLIYQINDGTAAKTHATESASKIRKIRDSICPTCERPEWITESAKKTENALLAEIAVCKEKIALGAQSSVRLEELTTEIANLERTQLKPRNEEELSKVTEEIRELGLFIMEEQKKEYAHVDVQNTQNTYVLTQFASKQQELVRNQRLEADQARGQLDVDRRAFEAAVAKLKAYDEAAKRYESALLFMKNSEAKYQVDLDAENEKLNKILSQITLAEELKKAIKTFLSISFDGALESISEAATKNIRCIPNMSNATIQFEGQKETQDGKIKEEVNAVISMDGEIGVPIKSLSGGERSSVDLAVDLAVIDFIESETSKGIDVFILDEPFTGLDTVSIEMALELLKNLNSTKKLIVVDHNPEVKQMVSNRIVVVRDGESSTIAS